MKFFWVAIKIIMILYLACLFLSDLLTSHKIRFLKTVFQWSAMNFNAVTKKIGYFEINYSASQHGDQFSHT